MAMKQLLNTTLSLATETILLCNTFVVSELRCHPVSVQSSDLEVNYMVLTDLGPAMGPREY